MLTGRMNAPSRSWRLELMAFYLAPAGAAGKAASGDKN
jgi:hypothetical protein